MIKLQKSLSGLVIRQILTECERRLAHVLRFPASQARHRKMALTGSGLPCFHSPEFSIPAGTYG